MLCYLCIHIIHNIITSIAFMYKKDGMVCYHEHWTIVAQTADCESSWNFIIFDIPASVYDGMQVVYSVQLCLYSGDAPIQTESNSDSELAVHRLMPCKQLRKYYSNRFFVTLEMCYGILCFCVRTFYHPYYCIIYDIETVGGSSRGQPLVLNISWF